MYEFTGFVEKIIEGRYFSRNVPYAWIYASQNVLDMAIMTWEFVVYVLLYLTVFLGDSAIWPAVDRSVGEYDFVVRKWKPCIMFHMEKNVLLNFTDPEKKMLLS